MENVKVVKAAAIKLTQSGRLQIEENQRLLALERSGVLHRWNVFL